MAPLWGSSWSSTWGSISGYKGNDANSSANTDLKPSLGQILTSKRIRYTASALAIVGVFFLAFRNYDQIPTLATMRGGYGDSPSTMAKCPPALVVPSFDAASVDWSQYAYTQYVTNKEYLCNSVMIFETLYRLKAKADRVMMYPENMMSPTETNPTSNEAKLLVKARDRYGVKLVPVSVQRRNGGDGKPAVTCALFWSGPASLILCSHVGGILYQTFGLQPNSISACLERRLGRDYTPADG